MGRKGANVEELLYCSTLTFARAIPIGILDGSYGYRDPVSWMAALPDLATRRKTIRDISKEILEIVTSSDRPFFFAGAGISKGSNLPSWTDFITQCVRSAFDKEASPEELARVHRVNEHSVWLIEVAAQHIRGRKGRNELLYRALWGSSPQEIVPSKAHYLLIRAASLHNIPILTTNFDDLLEIAAAEMGIKCRSYSSKGQLKSLDIRKTLPGFCVVHLHGKIPRSDSGSISADIGTAVASEFDYYSEYNSNSPNNSLLRRFLRKHRAIILGAGLSDANVNRALFATKSTRKPGKNTKHLWFTQLHGENRFARQLHEDFWAVLNVKPVYCSEDYKEIPAILRRISDHKAHPIAHVSERVLEQLRKYLDEKFAKLESLPTFQKCLNPWDQYEIDLYIDRSDAYSLRMDRVWHSKRSDGSNAGSRQFKLDWRCTDVLSHTHQTAVPDAIDCLCPHFLIRNDSIDKDFSREAFGQHAPFRSWSFISFPVFSPVLGRAAHLFVLKYVNRDNWLAIELAKGDLAKQMNNHVNDLAAVLERFLPVKIRVKTEVEKKKRVSDEKGKRRKNK